MSFFDVKDYDVLSTISQEKLQIMMEDYVIHLKKRISANTINIPIAAVKAFLDCNDVELRWSKIKRLKPANYVRPRLRIENFEAMLPNHN